MTEETVLVTGAGGYIGSRVAKRLMEEGYETILTDNFHKHKVRKVGDQDIIEADITNRKEYNKFFKDSDYVIHLAAITGVEECAEKPEQARAVNARGTSNLAIYSIKHDVPMVFPASMAILGEVTEFPVTPETKRNPKNQYGATKQTAELAIKNYSRKNFPAHIFIKSNVYGSHEVDGREISKGTVVNYFVDRAVKNQKLTVHSPGTQERDFIHVKDVAEAYLNSIENIGDSETGTTSYTIASGQSNSILEVARMVADKKEKLTGERPELEKLPNPRDNPIQYTDLEIDTSKTEEELGFKPEKKLGEEIEKMLRQKLND